MAQANFDDLGTILALLEAIFEARKKLSLAYGRSQFLAASYPTSIAGAQSFVGFSKMFDSAWKVSMEFVKST